MINKPDWTYLSYPLSPSLSGYGNGERIKINWVRSMSKGDTSNNSAFCMPSHFGTHIDFPFHFHSKGKTINDYGPNFFVFDNVSLISIENLSPIQDFLIKPEHLTDALKNCSDQTEFLILKTGFCNKRSDDEYWQYGYGIGLGVAKLLKEKLPRLRAIGFDLISLNSFQQRETGRIAHKEFLVDAEVLIVEDMDLRKVMSHNKIDQVIISPLNIQGAEGVPITIFANIDTND